MQTKAIALVGYCWELIPIIDMVNKVGNAGGLSKFDETKIHVSIHKYNAGTLVLAQTLPLKFTPVSKH